MPDKKEPHVGQREGRPRFVEGLEARTLLSAASAAAIPPGIAVPFSIVVQAASPASSAGGLDVTVPFEPGDQAGLAVGGFTFRPPAAFGDTDPFAGAGLAAVSSGHSLPAVSYDARPPNGFAPGTFVAYDGAGEGQVFDGLGYRMGVSVITSIRVGTAPFSGPVATPPLSGTVITIPRTAEGPEPQSQVLPPPPSRAIVSHASDAAGAGTANAPAGPEAVAGALAGRSAATPSIDAMRVDAGALPAVERSARTPAGPATALGAAGSAAQETGIAGRLQQLASIADATASASAGAVSALTPTASPHLKIGESLARLSGLVGIALPTVETSTLFSDTPLKLVEPAMTALPGLLLGLAPAPATAMGTGNDPGRGWEIAAAASLGVAMAGGYFAGRGERDARESLPDHAPGVRRVRGGWELVPLDRR